ncbi:uncharacterized protein F5147DRAFT_802246 [Suillus discolor]|uniref:Transmembrane protein n=1 Tax=Suillus discolor TaxID=1912936 RepID=A0A9P7JU22_9AGAM|nr:uncharacterized protein F5147DRAFT_802246 [Suillus discolor]KAG2107722.1 hypothetical protein F5147DRAFT_802246 [Suillus discolor]
MQMTSVWSISDAQKIIHWQDIKASCLPTIPFSFVFEVTYQISQIMRLPFILVVAATAFQLSVSTPVVSDEDKCPTFCNFNECCAGVKCEAVYTDLWKLTRPRQIPDSERTGGAAGPTRRRTLRYSSSPSPLKRMGSAFMGHALDNSIRIPDEDFDDGEYSPTQDNKEPSEEQLNERQAFLTRKLTPLRGRTLGFLESSSTFRLRLYGFLSHPISQLPSSIAFPFQLELSLTLPFRLNIDNARDKLLVELYAALQVVVVTSANGVCVFYSYFCRANFLSVIPNHVLDHRCRIFVCCFYFIVCILVLNIWLINLFVTNSFSAIRADTQKSAFGAAPLGLVVEEQEEGWSDGKHISQSNPLKEFYTHTRWCWVFLALASLVVQATASADINSELYPLVDDISTREVL